MRTLILLVLAAGVVPAQDRTTIRGTVQDSTGGEPLANVRLKLETPNGEVREFNTTSEGRFSFEITAGTEHTLTATLVGYRPTRVTLKSVAELQILLTTDNLARTDSISVRAGPFDLTQLSSASERTLSGPELENLSNVLVNDPLRAVQSLPGVASNDDFNAQFSLRGAEFERIGVYLDGVLLRAPFHSVQGETGSGSLTIFNGDIIESLALHSGAPPVMYEDRTAGTLDVRTREGSRSSPSVRFNAGVADAGVLVEGPMSKKGSWLVAARKSYLQYLLNRASEDATLAFGFNDIQTKLSYDLSQQNNVTLSLVDGRSGLDRSEAQARLGVNSIMDSDYHFTVANLGWRYTPASNVFLENHLAYLRERFDNDNRDRQPLGAGYYGEWRWSTQATWTWSPQAPLTAGASTRRMRDEGYLNRYQFNPTAVRRVNAYAGTALRYGGFVEQAWSTRGGLMSFTAGSRWDGFSESSVAAWSPHASLAVRVFGPARLHLAWGQAVQYPTMLELYSIAGNRRLMPERANHLVAAFESALSDRTRFRIEAYQRTDRDLIWQPLLEPRLDSVARIVNPPLDPPFQNSLRGYARGIDVYLQRRSANRLSGWVAYSLSHARFRDGILRTSFYGDFDQRHSVNAYGSYRIRPTVNLSARYFFGSNFPVPGFWTLTSGVYYVAAQRNQVRLPAYHRADVRINKSFEWGRWRGTLFAELANLTNRRNLRFDSYNGYNAQTARGSLSFSRLFPIVPAAGLMLEWEKERR